MTTFSRKLNDYVVAQDITNHSQIKVGDLVGISEEAYVQLGNEQRFWTTVLAVGTVSALTLGTGGIGVVGAFGGFGVAAEGVAIGAGIVGGTAAAVGMNAYEQAIRATATLKMKNVVCKVLRKQKKFMSELTHVEIKMFIPQADGTFQPRTEWVDAHHLMLLMPKAQAEKKASELQAAAQKAQREYDLKLRKQHRAEFAREAKDLDVLAQRLKRERRQIENLSAQHQSAKTQRSVFAGLLAFAPLLLLI